MAEAASVTLTVEQGDDFDLTIVWKDENGNVQDASAYTATFLIAYTPDDNTKIADWSSYVTPGASSIAVAVPKAQTASLDFHRARYMLRLTDASDNAVRLMEGPMILRKELPS